MPTPMNCDKSQTECYEAQSDCRTAMQQGISGGRSCAGCDTEQLCPEICLKTGETDDPGCFDDCERDNALIAVGTWAVGFFSVVIAGAAVVATGGLAAAAISAATIMVGSVAMPITLLASLTDCEEKCNKCLQYADAFCYKCSTYDPYLGTGEAR